MRWHAYKSMLIYGQFINNGGYIYMKYKITALLIEIIQPLLTVSYPCLCSVGWNFISISIKVLMNTSRIALKFFYENKRGNQFLSGLFFIHIIKLITDNKQAIIWNLIKLNKHTRTIRLPHIIYVVLIFLSNALIPIEKHPSTPVNSTKFNPNR